MPALSVAVLEKFCSHCQWAYETWQTASVLLKREVLEAMQESKYAYFFHRLQEMARHSFLIEIEKLHDSAVMAGRINLTLDYVLTYGGWDKETSLELQGLHLKLEGLHRLIKPARNRILAHNDLLTILEDESLGGFPAGMDTEYFEHLKTFCNTASLKTSGKPWPFADFGLQDAEEFVTALLEKAII